MLSIVIPTFNESANVPAFESAFNVSLGSKIDYEIIFIDDSTDNTPDILCQLTLTNSLVRYEHRERERGLGTAVVRGFQIAKGDVLTVLDADMQHPPDMLYVLLDQIEAGYDLVIPSRFVPGGDDGGLAVHRKLVSWVARMMGKLSLKKVRLINDPTGGFLMFRRDVIDGVELKPIGWKILIEILVRGHYQRVIEVPYQFHARAAGESKMSMCEQWNYVRHLFRLIKDSPEDRRFYTFALVGLSGVAINMAVYAVLVQLVLNISVAGTLSALTALLCNFALNDAITWKDAQLGARLIRALKYLLTSLIGIGIDVAILRVLNRLGVNYLVANLLGIAVATIWNYTINNVWTWRKKSYKPVIVAQSPNVTNSIQGVSAK